MSKADYTATTSAPDPFPEAWRKALSRHPHHPSSPINPNPLIIGTPHGPEKTRWARLDIYTVYPESLELPRRSDQPRGPHHLTTSGATQLRNCQMLWISRHDQAASSAGSRSG